MAGSSDTKLKPQTKREVGSANNHTMGLGLPVAPTTPNTTPPQCPECGSQKVWKDGMRQTRFGLVQRWICRECGYRFSETMNNVAVNTDSQHNGGTPLSFSEGSEHSERLQKLQTLILSTVADKPTSRSRHGDLRTTGKAVLKSATVPEPKIRRIAYNQYEAVNDMESRIQEKAAGATALDPATVKGKLVEFAFWMNKEGYKEPTIRARKIHLETLLRRGANLLDPDSVKKVIAEQKTWSDGTRANYVVSYTCFLQNEGMTWTPPRYKRPESIPFIPAEAELDKLIGAAGKKLSTFLQGLKETGADPGELAAITLNDINKESRTITINKPVKGHRPRIVTVSSDIINRLQLLTNDSGKIFDQRQLERTFYYKRKTTARKLTNPRLLKITFITFRHWKGTMEYHRTKDILHVQKLLGHKSIQNTLIYIDLDYNLFKTSNEDFTVRVAHDVGEACALIESGFEYVTGEYNDGGKIFRKRK